MKTHRFTCALLAALAGCWQAAKAQDDPVVIDPVRYAGEPEARAAWKPMAGSLPVGLVARDGQPALRLPCNFGGTKIERASWDRTVQLDLSSCRGVVFEVLCTNAGPVSHFSLYFQSGAGWYHAAFYPDSSTDWQTIRVLKADMRPEGQPGGWDRIETIRISAWRGDDTDTEFLLRNFRKAGVLGADAHVLVVKGDTVAERRPAEAQTVANTVATVTSVLESGEVGCVTVSDRGVGRRELEKAKLVVLPYNPTLPDAALTALAEYARSGKPLLAFYSVPPALLPVLNVADGPHVKETRAGHFAALRFSEGAPPGVPTVVTQQSWNLRALAPVRGKSQTWAEWVDEAGKPTGYAAVIGSTNAAVMTHILLPDDRLNKQRMLVAIAARLAPDVVRPSVEASIAAVGQVASYTRYEEAVREIRRLGGERPEVQTALEDAARLRANAQSLAAAGRFPEARTAAETARERLVEAFCRAQTPLPGEFRAFWCHSAFGVQGRSWDDAIRRLAENGFTAILPNMLWGGVAYYDSALLPMAAQARERGDQIRECVAAAKRHGVQVHVWKVNWNLGSAAPKEFVERLRREGRLQANSAGKEERWLCPSHPENQKLEIASLVEVARNYEVDGIHFDYIRYPDADHCFCAGCKERFQRFCRADLEPWPAAVRRESPLRQQWLEWRRSHITEVVRAVSEQARAVRPGIKISAAVFRNWPSDRDSVGQDWKRWCDRGYLDFVCPMDYTPNNRQFENMVRLQLEWAGKTPCYPGIGVSASSSRFGPDRAVEQINLTRKHRTGGFVIFNYGVRECEELLPMLGRGITRRQAEP
ncbi:MAG TPA: family 10 glycosylhydrolase [Verrucomicrobiota bacterium]|nr:family 10 glycosylhydrolase [Verrucomicrobiota bacterium]HRT07945.1 family 10 glycosylhydrolase [Candidatus Paceibacterota bacterium]HRT55052.1 family 10 glycosylhydrolase [Candidatus Paceibacterota bacterium]